MRDGHAQKEKKNGGQLVNAPELRVFPGVTRQSVAGVISSV